MADDFKVKVKAELDTSEAEQKLRNLTNGNKKVKLDVDSTGATKSLKETDSAIRSVTKTTQSFGSTLKSALNVGVAYGVMSKGFQLIGDTARKASDAVKDFDSAIMDLRMATGGSYSDISKLVTGYNKMGQQLGAVTKEVTNGADAWLRQGHTISDTNTLIKDSMMLAKIASIDTADATTYLTSAMKGYKVEVDDVSKIVDKLTSVDLVSATDAGGLAEAMSRTAVSASEAGVEMDRLIGYLAAVGEVTQEGMSVIGNSFKTFFARYSDIKADKLELIDEDGTTETLNDVEQSLKNVGIDMRSVITDFDDFDDTLDNLAKKWDTLNGTQKDAIAKAFGGVRQKNRFLVLMENYQNAAKYMDVAMDSEGSAANKFNAYLDTLEAKTKTLQATFEALAVNTISSELVGNIISATTAVIDFLDKTNLLKGTLAGLATAGAIKGFTLMATGISNAAHTLNDFNAALQMVKAGNLGDAEIQKLSVVTANLSQSQLKAVLSSEALSVSQRKAILMAHGMEEAEAEAALATMGLATTEGAATGATFTFTGALKGLWATLMANPLILVVAAITAIVAAYQSYKQKVQEARQAALEAGNAAKEEAANLRSLYAAYKQANEAYNSNAGSKENLESATESLLKALGVEQSEIDALIEKYGSLDKAIDQATIDALKSDYSDLLGGYNPAKKEVEEKGKTDLTGNTYDALSYYGDSKNNATQQARKFLEDNGYIQDMYGTAGGTSFLQGLNPDYEIDSFERIYEAYQKYLDMRQALEDNISDNTYSSEELSNSKLYQAINDRITQIRQEIETAEGYVDDINKTAAQIQIMEAFNEEGIPETQEEVDQFTESMLSAAKSNDRFVGTADDVRDSVLNVLSSMDELKNFTIKGSTADELMTKISENLDLTNNKELSDWINGLSDEELRIVANISANTDSADWTIEEWKSRLETELKANAVLNIDIGKESTKLDNFNTAISQSLSAKGLGDESIKNIQSMYKNIDGYDSSKLFEQTANGIKLNSDELAKLESQYEKLNKDAIDNKLEGLKEKYRKLTKEMEKCTDKQSSTYENLINERNAVVDDINSVSSLAAQYDGLTSAYQKWINAQSNGEDGDMYDTIRDGLEKAQKLYSEGLVGTEEFKSYVDLLSGKDLSSASVDEIVSAYEALGKQIGNTGYKATDFLKEGSDGVENFLNALNKIDSKWASLENGEWQLSFDNQEVADALGVDIEFVESMLQKLKDYGFEIDIDTSVATENFEQLKTAAERANEELVKAKLTDIDFHFDTTDVSKLDDEIKEATDLLNSLKDSDGQLNLDDTDVQNAQYVLAALLRQKQEISKPEIMKVDTSTAESDIEKGIAKLQELQNALNELEVNKTLGVDTSESEQKVQDLIGEVDSLSPEVKAALNLDTEEFDTAITNIGNVDISANAHINEEDVSTITSSLSAISPEMIVNAGVDDSKVANYKPEDKQATVTYIVNGQRVAGWTPPTKYGKVVYSATGGSQLNGTAHITGTAKAKGDWGADSSEVALIGEIAPELWVHAKTGTWELVENPQFRKVEKGDVIFNGNQTKRLLQNGEIDTFGNSFLEGTAYGAGRGSFNHSGSGSTRSGNNSSSRNSSRSSRSSSSSSSSSDEKEKVDWIEIKISRLEREIDNLDRTASSVFKKLSTRTNAYAKEISKITEEINVQNDAYNRYLKEAHSVGLDESIAKKVRNGTIDITEYGETNQKKIREYEEWYNKALSAKDAIAELNEEIGNLYSDKFDTISEDYQNQLSLIEHLTTTYENGIKMQEAKGYLISTQYYDALKKAEQENITVLNSELKSLTNAMSEAINSGYIKEGSKAWYEMQQEINSVKEAIDEANISVQEFQKSINKVKWEHFDFLQDRISNITNESDFLIELLSNSKLFEDNGTITENGITTMGLHNVNYDTFMRQADEYSKERKEIEKQLKSNPYDTELIERREELLRLQQESILAAEKEKEAIKNLTKDGFDLQLKSLKNLIDEYTEALDSSKDLYDYQKKISKQAEKITSLEKQIKAYAGDDSEENKARIQQLKVDLESAKEDLEESEYEHYISDQKKILDDLFTEYEEVLNTRLDDIGMLLTDSINQTNENAISINDNLNTAVGNVGYTLTEEMKSIWADGGAAQIVNKYGSSFSTSITAVKNVLDGIKASVDRMVQKSDDEAKAKAASTTKTTAASKSNTSSSSKSNTSSSSSSSSSKKRTDKENYGVALAIWNGNQGWGTGDTRKKRLEAKGFDYNTVQGIVNKMGKDGYIYSGAWVGKYYGITDVKPYAYNKFKRGARRINKNQIALTQEGGIPESIISREEGGIFTPLAKGDSVLNGKATETLWNIANNPDTFIKGHMIRDGARINRKDGFNAVNNNNFEINIPIERVQDYNDFVKQLQNDKNFESLIQAMTLGRALGKSPLEKYKINFK